MRLCWLPLSCCCPCQALAAELKRAKAATRTKQQAARRLEGHLQQLQAEMKNIMEVWCCWVLGV